MRSGCRVGVGWPPRCAIVATCLVARRLAIAVAHGAGERRASTFGATGVHGPDGRAPARSGPWRTTSGIAPRPAARAAASLLAPHRRADGARWQACAANAHGSRPAALHTNQRSTALPARSPSRQHATPARARTTAGAMAQPAATRGARPGGTGRRSPVRDRCCDAGAWPILSHMPPAGCRPRPTGGITHRSRAADWPSRWQPPLHRSPCFPPWCRRAPAPARCSRS